MPTESTEQPTVEPDLGTSRPADEDDKLMNLARHEPPETPLTVEQLADASLTVEEFRDPIISKVCEEAFEQAKAQREARLEYVRALAQEAEKCLLEALAAKNGESLEAVDKGKGVERPSKVIDKGKGVVRNSRTFEEAKGVNTAARVAMWSPPQASLRAAPKRTDGQPSHVPIQSRVLPRDAYPRAAREITMAGGPLLPTPAARPEATEAALREPSTPDAQQQRRAPLSAVPHNLSGLIAGLGRAKRTLQKLVLGKNRYSSILLPTLCPALLRGAGADFSSPLGPGRLRVSVTNKLQSMHRVPRAIRSLRPRPNQVSQVP